MILMIFISTLQYYLYLYTDLSFLYIYTSLQTLQHYTMYLAFMLLHLSWYLYTCLYTLMYLYDDTQARTYILYTFTILSMLSSCTFSSSHAALLLYDTHSFCELAWLQCFPLPHTHVSTYTHILYSLYICFHVP